MRSNCTPKRCRTPSDCGVKKLRDMTYQTDADCFKMLSCSRKTCCLLEINITAVMMNIFGQSFLCCWICITNWNHPPRACTTNKYLIALTYLFSQGQVRQKVSSRGKYVSVNIGPVQVVSSEQVFLPLKHIKDSDEISSVAFYWKAKGKGKKGWYI